MREATACDAFAPSSSLFSIVCCATNNTNQTKQSLTFHYNILVNMFLGNQNEKNNKKNKKNKKNKMDKIKHNIKQQQQIYSVYKNI